MWTASGFFHRGELVGGFFPLGGRGGDLVGDGAQLAVEVLEFAFVSVGLRSFQRGGDLGLLGFEFDDFLFQDADVFAEFADVARGGFGLAGGRRGEGGGGGAGARGGDRRRGSGGARVDRAFQIKP